MKGLDNHIKNGNDFFSPFLECFFFRSHLNSLIPEQFVYLVSEVRIIPNLFFIFLVFIMANAF